MPYCMQHTCGTDGLLTHSLVYLKVHVTPCILATVTGSSACLCLDIFQTVRRHVPAGSATQRHRCTLRAILFNQTALFSLLCISQQCLSRACATWRAFAVASYTVRVSSCELIHFADWCMVASAWIAPRP
jgi:hypothetical protein